MNTQPDFKPVYILGAGASKMIGGPLLPDFLSTARELRYSPNFLENEGKIVTEKLSKAFDEVFQYQGELLKTKAILGSDLDDLENLFSMLDMDLQVAKVNPVLNETTKKTGEQELSEIRESFLALVIKTLKNSITVTHQMWFHYQSLIKKLAQPVNTSFITFNYDLAIETALKNKSPQNEPIYKVNYGTTQYPNLTYDERLVLKLHGSANWVFCQDCETLTIFPDYANPLEFTARKETLHDITTCTSIDRFINLLIPPTWNKSSYTEKLTNVWANSIREISQATHLFIIGYSFPRTDVFFDQLLSLALRDSKNLKEVVVINPEESIKEILIIFFERHFFSKKVVFIPMKFEGLSSYLSSHHIADQKALELFIQHFQNELRIKQSK